jgi:hypothetical protein
MSERWVGYKEGAGRYEGGAGGAGNGPERGG